MTTRRRYATVACGVIIATACVWLAGCGLTPLDEILGDDEAAEETPAPTPTPTPTPTDDGTDEGDDDDDGDEGGEGDDDETVIYIWSLPPDPETPTVNDDSAYESLFRGDCESAAELITRTADSTPNYGAWTSPRAIVFTAAGVAYCRGDEATGEALARQAVADYGTAGLGPEDTPWCKLYRALQSVVEQRPAETFECRGLSSEGPAFRTGVDADGWTIYDDPLTAADESLPPPPPEPPSPDQPPAPSPSPAETPPGEPLPGPSDG